MSAHRGWSGIDGLELTRRLKSNPATGDIVVVALAAYARKGDEARLRAAGCDAHLSRPMDVATFAQTGTRASGRGLGVLPIEPG